MLLKGNWDDAEDAVLRASWGAGPSAAEIARDLNRSRNSIIGRAHRLGLAKASPQCGGTVAVARAKLRLKARWDAAKANKARAKAAKPKSERQQFLEDLRASQPAKADLDLGPLVLRLEDLEAHHCRWIPGEPTSGWCGRPKVPGLPYCKCHAARAFTAAQPTRPPSTSGAFVLPRLRPTLAFA